MGRRAGRRPSDRDRDRPVGVSGAVFLLPVQLTVFGVPNPAITPTNLLFNVVAGRGALWRYATMAPCAATSPDAWCWAPCRMSSSVPLSASSPSPVLTSSGS